MRNVMITAQPTAVTAKTTTRRLMTYRQALHEAMRQALAEHPQVVLMGQGVDDHKGVFGTTLGLAEEFGSDRLLDLPLAEEGTTGIGIGAALNGLYPIQTHIRADFAVVAMNQIVNLAAKYRYMFGGRFSVPMLIRLVVGRSWGQGAQHSQSLQSLFAHIPGLTVIMPSHPRSILESYQYAVAEYRNPVISLEHRLMYDLQFDCDQYPVEPVGSPFGSRLARKGDAVTIVATSIMVLEALRAAEHLKAQAGIDCEVIDLHCVSHPDRQMVLSSLAKTGLLVVADTSWQAYGVSAEVCRWVCESAPTLLRAPAVTLGMAPASCPTAKSLEDRFYPNLGTLVDAVGRLVTGKRDHGLPLPTETSMADVYKRFKGPF
jgi:acetoin:2,6-dichlorophenolindophenol oxidoreductase subunit beta